MIVNPDKFQAFIVQRNNTLTQEHKIIVGDQEIETKNRVKLLGIEIDNKLDFDYHVSTLCKKASNQLHTISRLQTI